MEIRTGDTYDPRVIALLDHHTTTARAQTAPGSAHALDLTGLQRPTSPSGQAGMTRRWSPSAR
jgi:putative acetyltransferase